MPRTFRAALLVLIGAQLLGAALLALRGFPYFGSDLVSNAPLWESPVAIFHLPGIIALTLTGYCCGFHNALVLGPRIVDGHIRMSPEGILILTLTNLALLLLLMGLWWGTWRFRRLPKAPVSNSGTAERP
jgi:hypothetical protein